MATNYNTDRCDDEPNIVEGCDALKRLICALHYYNEFDLINNENDRDTFNHFIFNIYTNLINDYIHLVDDHSNHIQQITEWLEKDGNFFITILVTNVHNYS